MRWDSTKKDYRSLRVVNKFAWLPTVCRGEQEDQETTVWLEQYIQLEQYTYGYDWDKWEKVSAFVELDEHNQMICIRMGEVLNDYFSEFDDKQRIQRLLPDGYTANLVDHEWKVIWNG